MVHHVGVSVDIFAAVLQYFTKPLEERLDMLASTLTPSIDIGSRFMTVDGESVKTVLWDTGELPPSFVGFHRFLTLI